MRQARQTPDTTDTTDTTDTPPRPGILRREYTTLLNTLSLETFIPLDL